MTVILNEPALRQLLESESGAVGQDLRRRTENVTRLASENAAGAIIGIDSGDLQAGIRYAISEEGGGLVAEIGTNARHRGFAYPSFHDRTGRPWLTSALRDGFNV